MPSRRSFLGRLLGAVAALTALPGQAGRPARVLPGRIRDTAGVTLGSMGPWVGSRFRASSEGMGEALQLLTATPYAGHRSGIGERFSLVFQGPADRPLGQGLYRLEHPRAGRFDLFLVPLRFSRGPGRRYEAVIHRVAPAGVRPSALTPS